MKSISTIATELEALESDYGAKVWVQYTTGFDQGVQESLAKVNAYQKDIENFRSVERALESAQDPIEKRGAQIFHSKFKKFRRSEKVSQLLEKEQNLSNQLMDVINKHRDRLDDREISSPELGKILTESSDGQLRKKAWESRIPLNKKIVDAGFLDLVNLRKEIAAAAGFDSYISYRLDEDELPKNLFDNWLHDASSIKSNYEEASSSLAQEHFQSDKLQTWDMGFLKAKLSSYNRAPVDIANFFEPTQKVFAKFGFDIGKLNLTFDIFPRKNKSEWGYSFTIVPGVDSRVLANVSNHFSDYWVLLHETAHGVHYLGLDQNQKALNAGVSNIVAEGFANFFGDLSYSKEFLEEVFPSKNVEEIHASFKKMKRVTALQEFKGLAMTLFDQQLYKTELKNLDDINQLRNKVEKDVTGSDLHDVEPPWAYLIHHTSAPVYLHSYMMGDVMNFNMKKVFARHNSGATWDQKPLEFGTFWKEKVLAPSGRYSLLELYEKVCEEKFQVQDYLRYLLT